MLTLLKGAAFAQLAASYKLPDLIQTKISEFARRREPERIIYYLQDQLISPACPKEDKIKIDRMLMAAREIVKDINGPEDSGTLVANFEAITKKRFEKPAWMSMEMVKVDI